MNLSEIEAIQSLPITLTATASCMASFHCCVIESTIRIRRSKRHFWRNKLSMKHATLISREEQKLCNCVKAGQLIRPPQQNMPHVVQEITKPEPETGRILITFRHENHY